MPPALFGVAEKLIASPQVSLSGATVDGAPLELSIICGRGTDASLVAIAQAMEAVS